MARATVDRVSIKGPQVIRFYFSDHEDALVLYEEDTETEIITKLRHLATQIKRHAEGPDGS